MLVVDDLRDSADSLGRLLEGFGHRVEVAYGGDQGLATARVFRPDVVILDLGMPPPDGVAVCRLMRGEPWCLGVCIVALTGWGQPQDRERTCEAGFDHHLVKPGDLEALIAILAAAGRKPGSDQRFHDASRAAKAT